MTVKYVSLQWEPRMMELRLKYAKSGTMLIVLVSLTKNMRLYYSIWRVPFIGVAHVM